MVIFLRSGPNKLTVISWLKVEVLSIYMGRFKNRVPKIRQKHVKKTLLKGRERQTKFSEFRNFFLDCHSDGKNLEDMCSFGRDIILKFQFLFVFKQSRF